MSSFADFCVGMGRILNAANHGQKWAINELSVMYQLSRNEMEIFRRNIRLAQQFCKLSPGVQFMALLQDFDKQEVEEIILEFGPWVPIPFCKKTNKCKTLSTESKTKTTNVTY